MVKHIHNTLEGMMSYAKEHELKFFACAFRKSWQNTHFRPSKSNRLTPGTGLFFCYKNADEYVQAISLESQPLCITELVITSMIQHPIRLFIDYEIYLDHYIPFPMEKIQSLISQVEAKVTQRAGKPIHTDKIVVECSRWVEKRGKPGHANHRQYKVSVHLYWTHVYFVNMRSMSDLLGALHIAGIDMNVYRDIQYMRTWGSYKWDDVDKRPLRLVPQLSKANAKQQEAFISVYNPTPESVVVGQHVERPVEHEHKNNKHKQFKTFKGIHFANTAIEFPLIERQKFKHTSAMMGLLNDISARKRRMWGY